MQSSGTGSAAQDCICHLVLHEPKPLSITECRCKPGTYKSAVTDIQRPLILAACLRQVLFDTRQQKYNDTVQDYSSLAASLSLKILQVKGPHHSLLPTSKPPAHCLPVYLHRTSV